MAYIASMLTWAVGAWAGRDLDLAEVGDLDELVDVLREPAAEVALCFVEEDDEYVAVVRVDGEDDPRVFVSDGRVLAGTGIAGRLLADSVESPAPVVPDPDESGEDGGGRPEVEPAGDTALLADLGVGGERLLELCAEEGMLPSDVIFAVAEALGAAQVLEEVRGV